jgi:hypothetical protein
MLNFFDKRNKLNDDELVEFRFRKIERKLNLLLGLGILQAALITFVAFSTFSEWVMPSWTTIILGSIVFLAGLFVFRKQIPGWLGAAGRYALNRSRRPKSSTSGSPTSNGVNSKQEEMV